MGGAEVIAITLRCRLVQYSLAAKPLFSSLAGTFQHSSQCARVRHPPPSSRLEWNAAMRDPLHHLTHATQAIVSAIP